MADPDLDAAQESVDAQARWGETNDTRAIARLLKWTKRAQTIVAGMRTQVDDLEARVKALENRPPV